MRNRLILLLLLCATGAAAQIPTLTNAAKIRYVQGNTVFDRPASDLLALVGAENISVTGNWTFSSNLTQLKDAGTYFYDDGDNTKLLRFQLSGVTTGTTRNLTVPNADGTIALTGAAYGGTGQSAVAQGDLLYGSAADTWSRLAKDANATRYLSNTGSSNNPAWAQVNLTNGVTGTLPGGNGGTGTTSFGAANRIPYASSTTVLTNSANFTYDGTTLLATTNSNSQTNNMAVYNSNSGSSAATNLRFWNNSSTASNRGFVMQLYSSGVSAPYGSSQVYWLYENANQIWATNAAARMLLNATGLYIGAATTPSERLHVSGNAYITGNISAGVQPALEALHISGNGYLTGNLGVGVQPATAKLHVSGTSNTTLLVQSNNTVGTSFDVKNTDTGGGHFTFAVTGSANALPAGSFVGYDVNSAATRYWVSPAGYFGITNASSLAAKLHVTGSGNTSATRGLIVENSDGTDIFTVRDDQMSAFGTAPVSTERLTVRGATSDNTTKAFVAERASGTDVLGVQNDGKVSINNAAYTEELTINGQAQMDNLVLTTSAASNVATGNLTYTDDATHGGYLTLGDGDRQLALMPTIIQRQAVDYNTNWTTGRTKAFWTVPARFNGWKVSKVYVEVSSIGSGAGDDQVEIEKGGSALSTLTVTAGTHTVVLDNTLATDDIFTFDITAISATPAKGLNVSLELSKN